MNLFFVASDLRQNFSKTCFYIKILIIAHFGSNVAFDLNQIFKEFD